MHLIHNAKSWYKMISVQMLMLIGSIQAVIALLPPETLAGVITGTFTLADAGKWATIAAAAVGAIGRVVDQNLGGTPTEPMP
jgi:hypothetical protein